VRVVKPRLRRYRDALPTREPIHAYTDGACSGNPGPAGIGVVLICGGRRKELSEYLGEGTNNIAELLAVKRALESVRDRARTVYLYSDSAYVLGLLGKGWKPKANRELVEDLRALKSRFADLRLVKVPGHAGVPENERADELARAAVARRR
jgi:ribonuclease HI